MEATSGFIEKIKKQSKEADGVSVCRCEQRRGLQCIPHIGGKEGGCECYSKYIEENCFNCFLYIL